jgi:hypothetical protein
MPVIFLKHFRDTRYNAVIVLTTGTLLIIPVAVGMLQNIIKNFISWK